MPEVILLRVSGKRGPHSFCAGAVFGLEPPICIRAGDIIGDLMINRGLDKAIALCKLYGFDWEIVE